MKSKKLIKNLKKGSMETSEQGLRNKATSERWQTAHESEREYWEDYTTDSLKKESGERYSKKAEILLNEWSKFIKINPDTKILQIGCGPEDVINYFKKGKKYSIDPLADYYKKRFDFNYDESNLVQGRGEEIPFPDKFFDIVIIINVLDHTELPDKVLLESKRVLKDNGLFHFEDYVYQKKFIQIAKIWGKIKKLFTGKIFNVHHPYMFTMQDLKRLISKEFKLIHEEIGRDIGLYENLDELENEAKKEKKLSRRILARLGLLGLINYTIIGKKK